MEKMKCGDGDNDIVGVRNRKIRIITVCAPLILNHHSVRCEYTFSF